ncbi:hypothetical protein GCM10009546_41130 [Actinomadura livida]|uniref:DUF397 domain-containing protein n=1 Tax=Actinomadura livida TaxID=79909 RepID=A0ABP3PSB7_9ACTN|nr:hypothetical protein GCM10010208_70830 [Actinomadura livida]
MGSGRAGEAARPLRGVFPWRHALGEGGPEAWAVPPKKAWGSAPPNPRDLNDSSF